MSSAVVTPTPSETVDSLAGRIKGKYPDYADTPNADLVDKIVQKHPEYGDTLSAPERLKLPGYKQAFLAKQAQPTGFEKARADASNTPWTDIAKGLGEGALATTSLVGKGIHAIPGIGPAIIPSQGLGAEEKISIPRTAGEKLGSNIEGVAEAALPIGEVADAVKGSKFVRPAARFLSENVVPMVKSLPYVGRGIEAAEKAPTLVKAAIRGGTTGAVVGAGEQAVRTHDLGETAKGALYGGAGGALLGMGAHGINRLAAPPEIPAMSSEPFHLTSPPSEREPAIQQRMEFPKANDISFRTDANGTRWAQLPNSPAEVSIPKNLSGADAQTYAQEKLDLQSNFAKDRAQIPAAGHVGPPMQRLGELIEQGAGTRPLEPAIPLRNQLPNSVGSAAEGFMPTADTMKNAGGPITFRREPIVKIVSGLEEGPLRAKAGEQIPTMPPEEIGRQMGAPPLQPDIPLRGQLKPTGNEPPSRQLTLEQKYPDREVRQLVHANGEDIVQAAGNDRDALKAIHDLKNPDVRQALINSGEDMGQMSIGNRKAMGESQMTRQDAFKKLLAKGYSPQQIVDLAKQSPDSIPTLAKPGPVRATRPATREKTGD